MRKALSKKSRFEVFKRDSFTCQYCGAHPPSVILHVDHIHPVSKGGTNDTDNLITSCESCNLGKSDRVLSDVPQSLQEKAAMVLEREAQINGYQQAMESKRFRIQEESELVLDVYEEHVSGFTLTEKSMVTVRHFVDQMGLHATRDAMEKACTSHKVRRGHEFKYFCGICWNTIKGRGRGN